MPGSPLVRRGLAASKLARAVTAGMVVALAACDSPLDPALALTLAQPSVEFQAVRGQSTPLTRTINVGNTGGGRLGPVTCTQQPAAWLTCAVTGGNVLTLTANPSGLATSPPDAVVEISAAGLAQSTSLTVAMRVEAPVLAVGASTAEFSATEGASSTTPSQRTIMVTNTGPGGFGVLGAISCVPTPANPRVTCSVDQGTGALGVTVDPSGLAPGTYIFPVSVTSANSTVTGSFAVTLTVGALPRILLSQNTLHFSQVRGSATPESRTVTISNSGGGSLGTVTCSAPASWLTCSVSGTTLTITANASGLTATPFPATVSVNATGAANSPQTINVTMSVEQPLLALTENSTTFTAIEGVGAPTPATRVIGVLNVGAGTLASLGTITCQPQAGSPVTCSVNQATGLLTLSVQAGGLTPGVSVHPVTVSASNSSASQSIAVVLTVTGRPIIVFSENPVVISVPSGSTFPVSRIVDVTNGGGGTLGALSCPPNPVSWMTCSVNEQQITITVFPNGVTQSPPPAVVEVTAENIPDHPEFLTVEMTIQQQMALDQNAVSFTASAAGQAVAPNGTTTTPTSHTIQVLNASGGSLAALGQIGCQPGTRVGCSVNQFLGQVTLTANPVGLPPGTYNLVATITAQNASNSQQVAITLTVTP
jgi:hypothetical protein